jgi:hypothetical protein
MRSISIVAIAAATLLGSASLASAQDRPLPAFELDARVFTTRIGQDATTATALSLTTGDLPSSAKGFALGGNVYPLRGKSTALGFGVETIFGRGQLAVANTTGQAFLVQTYISGAAGQVSLNFGHNRGWSYISAGAGPLRINTFSGDAPLAVPPGRLTVNFGGGARWFNYEHVAIGFDVRFYLTQGNAAGQLYAARDPRRILVISGGLSFK